MYVFMKQFLNFLFPGKVTEKKKLKKKATAFEIN